MTSWNTGNGLLDRILSLVPSQAAALRPLSHRPGALLYEPDQATSYLHFPAGGIVSVLVRRGRSPGAEVATVGSEGVVPLPALLRRGGSPGIAVQQLPGIVIRTPAAPIARALRDDVRMQTLVHRYAAYCLEVAYQTSACSALHDISSRTARWLLVMGFHCASRSLEVTQATLAQMLGAQRQSVSAALNELARSGAVAIDRGRIRLLSLRRLERSACGCYRLLIREPRQIFG